MADSAVAVTAGTGTNIDTRTEATNGNHRQVIVIGDPATNAGVAPVDVTAGLKVDLGADNDVTVTGSVTANAGTNLNTSALALETGGNLASAVTALQIMDDWDNAASDGASVSGDVAHDTADAGEPVKIGAKAIAALSGATLVAAADRSNAYSDLDGAIIVRGQYALGDLVNGNASNTDGTSTEVLAAGAAGIKHYVTDVTITNTSSTNIYVELKDGSTTKWTFPVPANSGVVKSFQSPIAGTAATAWNFDPSAAATTVYCSVSGFKSKV